MQELQFSDCHKPLKAFVKVYGWDEILPSSHIPTLIMKYESVSQLLNLNFTVRVSFMEYFFVFYPFISTIIVAIVKIFSIKITVIGN